MKKSIYLFVVLMAGIFSFNTSLAVTSVKQAPPVQTTKQQTATNVQYVSPLQIVDNPLMYLNKTVSFSGEFVSFTSLGLDYKPAFRDGSKYIGILMRRNDVKDHTIPLSELKMFMKREMAEKVIDIETGDTFNLTGKVFSTALGDPWLDITDFKITNKKNKDSEKSEKSKK